MSNEIPTFHIHDASFHAYRVEDCECANSLLVLNQLLSGLRNRGWTIWPCPKTAKQYKSLAKYWKRGRRGDLEMKANASGRGIEVKFFQNVANVENPHGGEYDSGRIAKMPYLLRLRTQFELQRLREQATALGFTDQSDNWPKSAYGRMIHDRRRISRSHRGCYENDDWSTHYSNGIDADGVQMSDFDVRACYDVCNGGYICQGEVFHDINNMWFLIPNDSEIVKAAAWELFTYNPAKHPRRKVRNPVSRMQQSFNRRMAAKEFEAAASVARAIAKLGRETTVTANIEVA
jgi:hypothetical protein